MSHSTAPQIPVGTIFAFAGELLPQSYLYCDGASISRETYWELFQSIGLKFTGVINPTNFSLPSLNLLDLYPSGVTNVTGSWTPEDDTGLTTNFTLTSDNIPSFSTNNVDFNLTFVNNNAQMTTNSVSQPVNATVDNNSFFTSASPVTGDVAVTAGAFNPVYSGGGANPVTEPVTVTNNVLPSIKITYIIKAWTAETSLPPAQPSVIVTTYDEPSTAINPNANVPNLSGFIF